MRDFKKTNSDIEQFGFSVVLIEGTEYLPAFAYSIGLWKTYKHPEVIVFGLPSDTLHAIINSIGEFVSKKNAIHSGRLYDDFLDNLKNTFLEVDSRNMNDYFGFALDFYEAEVPALEFIWPDNSGLFPWDENFTEDLKFAQPLLDRNYDFKFMESENLGVFTTRQWLEDGHPIVHVVHDYDGDWQFLTGDQSENDIKLVALKQLVGRDNTLNDVFDLDYGEEAIRDSVGGEWERNYFDENEEK